MQPNAAEKIRILHRQRKFAMKQRIRITNALEAYLRTALGWSRDLPEDDQTRIKKAAKEFVADFTRAQAGKETKSDGWKAYEAEIRASLDSCSSWDAMEEFVVDEMCKLLEDDPLWTEFGKPIRGFALKSLSSLIGEAGDPAQYRSESALWKRFGLAPITIEKDGALISKAPSTWRKRGGLTADQWTAAGDDGGKRFAWLFVISDCFIKQNDGKYRAKYDARKAIEKERDPEIKPIIAERRARRAMLKLFIRDFYRFAKRRTAGVIIRQPKGFHVGQPADKIAA